jgi:predicted RNase H-like nuclease
MSRQTWGLRQKILEAEAFVGTNSNAIEVHPEVSFSAMNGAPIEHSKKTWNGQMVRRCLLGDHGIVLPDRLDGAGAVPPDDLLDAAAAAWSAWRVSRSRAHRLPLAAGVSGGSQNGVIWY